MTTQPAPPTAPSSARRVASALAVMVVLAPLARADELFLAQGGSIDGRVVESRPDVLRIQTTAGVLDVPTILIARRVRGPSVVKRYEAVRDAGPHTAARELEVADWCRQHGLDRTARTHVEAALKLDPGNPDIRRAAGYVLLGDVWLFAGLKPPPDSKRRSEIERRIVDQLVAGWHRRVRAIHDEFLGESDRQARNLATGRQQLMSLKSPLAIPGACRFLYGADLDTRRLLTEFLGAFDDDMARLNLLAITLLDDDEGVRGAAADQLARHADPRVVSALRAALRCSVDKIVRRAAAALGHLKDRSVVPDLIDALTTDAFPGRRRSLPNLITWIVRLFARPTEVPLTDGTYAYPSAILIPGVGRTISAIASAPERLVGRHRSEVQEALIAITGENFGFDAAAWREWARRLPPLPPPMNPRH